MIRGSHAQVMKPVHVPSSRPQIPCFFFLEHRMHASLDLKESIMSVSQNQKKKKEKHIMSLSKGGEK